MQGENNSQIDHSTERIKKINLNLLTSQFHQSKFSQIPLDFQYPPIQIISKQLTKLSNKYQQRVLYLGPRWSSNLLLHKKYARSQIQQYDNHALLQEQSAIPKYQFEYQKIRRSSLIMNQFKRNRNYNNSVYYRAFQGINPTISTSQQSIQFDASFESSNLDCAIKISDTQYDLFLRIDSNTNGQVQWYYFLIKNLNRKNRIKLNICNIMKSKTLYQKVQIINIVRQDMKPYVFSKNKNIDHGSDWQQKGQNLTFTSKKLRYQFLNEKISTRELICLSFQYQFQYAYDQVYFAYCIPYTYSKLLKQINQLKNIKYLNQEIVQISTIGYSLMGLPIPVVQITDQTISYNNKKLYIAISRIHPGQSNSSIVMSSFMKYLCSQQSAQMRKKGIFILVPMINPDGVVLGNYRTSSIGRDLNRQFYNQRIELIPQISNLKKFISNIRKLKQIHMFLDFHGHSKKKNSFIYGPQFSIYENEYYKSKILPKIISMKTQIFRYYSCIFKIDQTKKLTARSYMFQQFGIPYTYTIQSSNGFYYDSKQMKTYEFNRNKWMQLGKNIGMSLLDYCLVIQQFQTLLSLGKIQKKYRKEKMKEIGLNKSTKKYIKYNKYKLKQTISSINFQAPIKYQKKQQGKQNNKNLLFTILDQIKQQQNKKNNDENDSNNSDSHNEQNYVQKSKMNQLDNAIIKNIKSVSSQYQKPQIANKIIQQNHRYTQKKKYKYKKQESFNIKQVDIQTIRNLLSKPRVSMQNQKINHHLRTQTSINNNNKIVQNIKPSKQQSQNKQKIKLKNSISYFEKKKNAIQYQPVRKYIRIQKNLIIQKKVTQSHNFLTDTIFNNQYEKMNNLMSSRLSIFNNKIKRNININYKSEKKKVQALQQSNDTVESSLQKKFNIQLSNFENPKYGLNYTKQMMQVDEKLTKNTHLIASNKLRSSQVFIQKKQLQKMKKKQLIILRQDEQSNNSIVKKNGNKDSFLQITKIP